MRAPPEMLYEVITNTIYLDNAINEVISMYFGAYNIKEDEKDSNTSTLEPLEKFHRFFLQELGANSKLKLIKEIGETCYRKIELPKGFEEKFRRFYIIRNIFAHNLYPKHVDGKELPNNMPNDANWEELHKEHKGVFDELNNFIIKKLYTQVFEDCFM
ncbi:MAG: hypothetical protein AABX10_00595 [Nanoarchaeota archaeon]